MEILKEKKLLLIGGGKGSPHIKTYFELIDGLFGEVKIVSAEEVDFCDSEAIDFQLKNPIVVLRSIQKLKQIIRDFRPDIIHVHQANGDCFITHLANKNKFPVVLTTWGSDVLLLPKQGKLLREMVKFNLRKADVITADACFMRDAIRELVPSKKVNVLNFGISTEQLECDVNAKKPLIYSNRLHHPLYRIDRIVSELIPFLERHSDMFLRVAADGSMRNEIEAIAKSSPVSKQIEFAGFVERKDNNDNYKLARFFVSIPKSDGTAVSLLEAMAAGCIPVLSDLPANREWVKDGENGIIVGENETVEEALERALLLDVSVVATRNADIIQRKAKKSVNRSKFEEVYCSLLND